MEKIYIGTHTHIHTHKHMALRFVIAKLLNTEDKLITKGPKTFKKKQHNLFKKVKMSEASQPQQ